MKAVWRWTWLWWQRRTYCRVQMKSWRTKPRSSWRSWSLCGKRPAPISPTVTGTPAFLHLCPSCTSESDGVGVCHLTSSRIEWVWLHWSEYLKASEEFEVWLSKQQRNLDVRIELQLGVKEKLWQVDQQRVVVSDIHAQAGLLERLLDEAAALHNRTQDPSVEAQAQERLQEAYNDVRDRAEVRTAHILTRGFSSCCSSPSSSTHCCCLCVASGSHQ